MINQKNRKGLSAVQCTVLFWIFPVVFFGSVYSVLTYLVELESNVSLQICLFIFLINAPVFFEAWRRRVFLPNAYKMAAAQSQRSGGTVSWIRERLIRSTLIFAWVVGVVYGQGYVFTRGSYLVGIPLILLGEFAGWLAVRRILSNPPQWFEGFMKRRKPN